MASYLVVLATLSLSVVLLIRINAASPNPDRKAGNLYAPTNRASCNEISSFTCSDDCMSVLTCPDEIEVQSCTPGEQYCHQPISGDAKCSVAARCEGAPLYCAEEGVYPDPYFCSIYHTCSAVDSYSEVSTCVDSAYNIATGECDLPLDDAVCVDGLVPECTSIAQSGALYGSIKYYYRCRRDASSLYLYHRMYKCLDDEYFDEALGICMPA